MLNLPLNTKFNKPLPKKAIYEKFSLKNDIKEKFDADVSKIAIINEISSATTTFKTDKVESLFVLHVLLKHEKFDEKNIILLSNLIDQHILFVLECGKRAKLAVFHQKLFQTDWVDTQLLSIKLIGATLDTVWENIIIQIGDIRIDQGNTLDEQLQIDDRKRRLQKQIEIMERQARAEKQPKRKFELVQEIKKLEKLI